MPKKGKELKRSNPKVLTGLSAFLLLMGGMITDPLAGFSSFVLAFVLAAVAVMRGVKMLRCLALALLIVAAALAISTYPEAFHHLGTYKSHNTSAL